MKKRLALLLVAGISFSMLVGCTNNAPQTGNQPQGIQEEVKGNLPEGITVEEVEGLTVYTDLKNSPFEDSGLKITLKKGDGGYAKFVKTDLNGAETADYYLFDYENKNFEKYYYVSAMGTAYHYYYDLGDAKVVKVENKEGADVTQSLKDSGRLEGAQATIEKEIEELESYYSTYYKMTIEEAVAQK